MSLSLNSQIDAWTNGQTHREAKKQAKRPMDTYAQTDTYIHGQTDTITHTHRTDGHTHTYAHSLTDNTDTHTHM